MVLSEIISTSAGDPCHYYLHYLQLPELQCSLPGPILNHSFGNSRIHDVLTLRLTSVAVHALCSRVTEGKVKGRVIRGDVAHLYSLAHLHFR